MVGLLDGWMAKDRPRDRARSKRTQEPRNDRGTLRIAQVVVVVFSGERGRKPKVLLATTDD